MRWLASEAGVLRGIRNGLKTQTTYLEEPGVIREDREGGTAKHKLGLRCRGAKGKRSCAGQGASLKRGEPKLQCGTVSLLRMTQQVVHAAKVLAFYF